MNWTTLHRTFLISGQHLLVAIVTLAIATSFSFRADAQEAAAKREVQPRLHPELAEHTQHFEKRIYKIAGRIHAAVGWDLANTILVEGDSGVIIVDTGGSLNTAREVEKELRKITTRPVIAVVYTHFHPDHINGVKAYASDEEVRAGKVAIYAHETLLKNVENQSGTIGPILSMRSAYSFGRALDAEDHKGMNAGIGPISPGGQATFIAPTKTFKDRLDVTIAGVQMQMVHVPSEAPDEIAIYLPQSKTLLSAEVIQGPTLPNIHTLRGTSFRDPVKWFKSIDLLRSFKAENLVPAHGQPSYGAASVDEVLRMYRDGIQFVHDQTIRHMNKGLTPDELANVVTFPPHLANFKPYLREYYGTVKHAVRQIYQGYLGWFEGDPVALDPIPRLEAARRYIQLMGGRDKVYAEARKVYEAGDSQWAAELATHLIRVNHEDKEARLLKANALRKLGYAQMNINWRNWYLMAARELEGGINLADLQQRIAQIFSSPDLAAAFPASVWVEGFTTRLKAEQTLDVNLTMGFIFPDVRESYALEIRRGVAQFHERMPDQVDAAITLDKSVLNRVLLRQLPFAEGVQAGDIRITRGTVAVGQRFFGYFEQPFASLIELTVR